MMIQEKDTGYYIRKVLQYVVLILIALGMLLPFWFMFIGVFRTNEQISSAAIHLWPENGFLYSRNLIVLFQQGFAINLWNSLFVTVVRTAFTLLFSCMAGFAFSKLKFPFRNTLFFITVFTLMIPSQIAVIPNYLLMTKMHWLNTYQALIIPGVASGFGIFLMRQYMAAIPDELIDCGRIDGMNDWRLLFSVIIPLTQGGLVVLGIFTTIGVWNDFFWPLIVITKQEMYTAPLRLYSLQSTNLYDIVPMGAILAGSFISSLPMFIIFIAFRNRMLSGILSGSIKS